MEKQWRLNDEGLAEAFEFLSQDDKARLLADMDRNIEASAQKMHLEADELARRNQSLRELLERRRQFLERLKTIRDEVRAEDEAFRRESEQLLAA
jgi:ketosteroid isomerase-like protein